jgi:hypothetical protein
MLFHAPQASQRPAHFWWDAPQAVHVKVVEGFAMRPFLPERRGRCKRALRAIPAT